MKTHPALWSDVRRDFDAAEQSSDLATARAKSLEDAALHMTADVRFDREVTVSALLQSVLCALETALERLVDSIDGDAPRGVHLIERAANEVADQRPAMISEASAKDVLALRRFRERLWQDYRNFDYELTRPHVDIAEHVVHRIRGEIAAFGGIVGIVT
jgi:hypothetical protein